MVNFSALFAFTHIKFIGRGQIDLTTGHESCISFFKTEEFNPKLLSCILLQSDALSKF